MKSLANQVDEFKFCPMGDGKPLEGKLVSEGYHDILPNA